MLISLFLLLVSTIPLAAQEMGSLKTKVKPGRAGVFVNGEYLGPAANFKIGRKYALTPGPHEVKLIEPRYEEITRQVTIEAGRTTVLKETMKRIPSPPPPYGVMKVKFAEKYSAVYINGHYYGHADEYNGPHQGQKLVPGEYTVRIVPRSGAAHEEKIKIKPRQTTLVRVR